MRECIKEKRRGKLSKGFLFLQDNAPIQRSHVSVTAFYDAGFEMLAHPAYSPDLAPSDFSLFLKLKEYLINMVTTTK